MSKRTMKMLRQRRNWYRTINSVYYPILESQIIFNAQGIHHLKFDSKGRPRTAKEQRYRFKLLPHAPFIIQSADAVFDYKKRYSTRLQKHYEIWEFRHVIQEPASISVVLKRTGNGPVIFFSIWRN